MPAYMPAGSDTPPYPEDFPVNTPQVMDVDEDQSVPQIFRDFCREKGADFPTRKNAKQEGWSKVYKDGPHKGQPLPTLSSFIFNFPDPTLLPSESLYVVWDHLCGCISCLVLLSAAKCAQAVETAPSRVVPAGIL